MKTAFLDELAQRRAEIGQRWRSALKDAPRYTALANPDTLAYLIEPTLDRLFEVAGGRASTPWSPQAPPEARLVDAASRCALNPMISYYFAGEAALVAVTRSIRPRDGLTENDILTSEGELLMFLHKFGHDEIRGFCEICLIEAPAALVHGQCGSVPSECPFKADAKSSAENKDRRASGTRPPQA